jgi:spermidine/putrescine transport system ATP-binding protein
MHSGQVEQVGTPLEIYEQPASPFVARFIGQANFLSGQVIADPAADPDGGPTPATAQTVTVMVNGIALGAIAPHQRPALGETVTLMIRPERITLGSGGDMAGKMTVTGTTVEVTYIGQRVEVLVDTPLGHLKVVQLGDSPAVGETVPLTWSRDRLVLLGSPSLASAHPSP